MNEAEAFGTTRLNKNHHASVTESLPKCLDYQLPLDCRAYLLKNETENDKVKFATLTSWYHSKRVDPEHRVVELVLGQKLA